MISCWIHHLLFRTFHHLFRTFHQIPDIQSSIYGKHNQAADYHNALQFEMSDENQKYIVLANAKNLSAHSKFKMTDLGDLRRKKNIYTTV